MASGHVRGSDTLWRSELASKDKFELKYPGWSTDRSEYNQEFMNHTRREGEGLPNDANHINPKDMDTGYIKGNKTDLAGVVPGSGPVNLNDIYPEYMHPKILERIKRTDPPEFLNLSNMSNPRRSIYKCDYEKRLTDRDFQGVPITIESYLRNNALQNGAHRAKDLSDKKNMTWLIPQESRRGLLDDDTPYSLEATANAMNDQPPQELKLSLLKSLEQTRTPSGFVKNNTLRMSQSAEQSTYSQQGLRGKTIYNTSYLKNLDEIRKVNHADEPNFVPVLTEHNSRITDHSGYMTSVLNTQRRILQS